MKRRLLKFLYRRYETIFADLIVESYFGEIPASMKVPAIDFLAGGRNVLERFFALQAYQLTRRAIGDIKNKQFYDGALMIIKALTLSLSRSKEIREDAIKSEEKNDPMTGVQEYFNLIKKDEKENKESGKES